MHPIPGGRFRHKLIQFLTKKPYRDHIRDPKTQAPRSIPKPVMPPSENSKISANYYYQRDLRREVKPPVSVLQKQLAASAEEGAGSAVLFEGPVPGNKYNPGEAPYPHEMSLNDRIGTEGVFN